MQISQLNVSPATPGYQTDVGLQRQAKIEPARVSVAPVELPTKAPERAGEVADANSIAQATDKINKTIRMLASNLSFTVDEETGMDVVKVVDMDTKEVIRQFPSEEVLAIAKALDQLQGLLVKDKA
jgi:flagellar protein FlaG